MPFTLPQSALQSDNVALVLAFGKLSVLEACSVMGSAIRRAEAPDERITTLQMERLDPTTLSELSGAHKCALLTETIDSVAGEAKATLDLVASYLDEKSNVSMSGYGVSENDYEDLVRSMLDGLRERGLRKVRLLRPDGNELLSEQIISRKALDVVVFPYHGGFALGPTVWVPDSAAIRQRGTKRPAPRADIALSPRLARTLVNLAGLAPRETLLDPFCGAGTILMEAYAKSIRCLGVDSRASRVQEARENLKWTLAGSRAAGYDIRKGDARDLPRMLRGTKVDGIVTEPLLLPKLDARPRTVTARAMIAEAAEVYNDALASMAECVNPGGRIVIVVPVIQTMDGDEVSMSLEGRNLGLRPFQPGPVGFEYPVRLSFESTRWVKRAVYVFEPRD